MTHVYTDGSALNAVEQAGYGLTIQHPEATRKDISEACGQHCNNYDAELKAIRSALQTISEDCDNPNPPCVNNIVIFTDSQSAIQAIAQMQHHKQPIVTDILTTANKLHNQNDVETSIQWIPGHCDIPGNDRADKLALHPSRSYKRSLGRFGMTGGLVATLDRSTTSTNKRQTRQTPSTNYTEHIRLPYFASEHTMHR